MGQYEINRMPFGLKNAPAVFQRYFHDIFRDLIDEGVIVIYIDDLLIAAATLAEHNQILKIVAAVSKANAKAKQPCTELLTEIKPTCNYISTVDPADIEDRLSIAQSRDVVIAEIRR